MTPRFIDLHTHTTASDGSDSPADLVRKATEAGLAAVAVTDHDTVAGLDEAVAMGHETGIEVVRGCELGVRSEYGEIHILGLWLPEKPETLLDAMKELRRHRNERNERIVDNLRTLGMDITYEEVRALSGGVSVGRPHIALALLRHGYIRTPQEAFDRFIGPGAPAYAPKKVFSPAEGVRLLASCGATVAIAHPMLLRCPEEWLDDTVADLKAAGLDAIEAYHSEHSHKDERRCVDIADRHGLVLTGGSDYHGKAKPAISLGRGRGGLRVTTHVLDNLKRHRRERGLPV
ncbi:PHP domain-containing protein [Nitratidesulfovibrio vulgaris]|jgi:hypothetical protein|uniref:PHP C-terminal domain protein n=1 Tax=Nitratidesulfovibrio vulgaris (strain DP4) TaxID=391774 RepID=A0A0H3AA70_NITV4|nr:PHP domain-containing protein [Nitratidesulfovibrio vulgaris]ABM29321.1 PHP C-terminal domain protein [Nitratidesulfovibrio vulgaris DP4]WCB46188.1 PHP domain-containing protein [Nitratidesulfovibrio vulgaris]GEB79964.1 phosphatase [Desulfovibrio desulfuricans]HBW15339.1 phosphatase [Desulfovibrio sp.]